MRKQIAATQAKLSLWVGRSLLPGLPHSVVLAPVCPVATAVGGDFRQQKLGGKPSLAEVRFDSLSHLFHRNLWVEKYEHRGAGSAEGSAEDARFTCQLL